MKTKVMREFLLVGHKLHIVIATTAFSIGIDIPKSNSFGSSMQSGGYVQKIGQAGRDGEESQAILLFKKSGRYILRSMKLYAKNKSECRRCMEFVQTFH